ncbi:hypothetical protein EU538_07965 [Candidatus Thorarchaeota archaeon]|nr:MAG: hypothetical protein EU538_07965 [Candidatus Thorarchaeota archaeon]
MNGDIDFKTLVLYLSSIALVLFYLIYMPWTAMSALTLGMWEWVYYFTLVLGLLFPLFYAIGEKDMSWYCLGLGIVINSIVWMALVPAEMLAAAMIFLVGLFFFLTPILKKYMSGNWEMLKNLIHILIGLFFLLGAGFHANWVLDDFVGITSINHIMPQFIFIGGGIAVAFAVVLLMYGLLNLLEMYIPGSIGDIFGKLGKVFYMLMVLVFLLGITFDVTFYLGTNAWGAVTFPTSIDYFSNMSVLGNSNLVAILLIILYVYGMMKIVEKNGEEETAQAATTY